MDDIRVLFTAVGKRVELIQEFRNAASVLGKTLKIYGVDIVDTAPALAYCDPVSYTHLDVYKRQPLYSHRIGSNVRIDSGGAGYPYPALPCRLLTHEAKERFVWRRGRPSVPVWDFC